MDNYFTSNYWRIFKMTDVKKELLAPCGLYCGVCRIYQAYRDNDLQFKKEILTTLNDYGVRSIDDIVCTGCLSEDVVFQFCQKCPIKECIKYKKIEGCYQCENFPCEIINKWSDPLDKKVMFRSIPTWQKLGTKKWVEEEEKRYQCPQCGYKLFHGAENCRNCDEKVNLD